MTTPEVWTETEDFLTALLCPPDADLAIALHRSEQERLPRSHISALQGRQISLLAKMIEARRILEIGTLGGYSTLWLAKTLPPDGRMVTIENNPLYALVATDNLKEAGLSERVQVLVGNAADQLAHLIDQKSEPYDFFFIDADEHNNEIYFDSCLRLGHPGSVIVIDNVVRSGEVRDLSTTNPPVLATQQVLRTANSENIEGAVFQTVGRRGHDGMLVARIC